MLHHIHHFPILGALMGLLAQKGRTGFGKPSKFDMEKVMKTLKTFENENETNVDSKNEQKGSDSLIYVFGIV